MVDTGRRPAVNPDDVLEVFEETDAPFLSTSEVADAVDVSKPTAIDRLRTLQEEGAIRSREVAGNTPVWYLPELENRRLVQYTDDDDEYRTLARAPPEERDPEVSPDGAATGDAVDVVNDLREDVVGAVHQIEQVKEQVEHVEEEVSRFENLSDTPTDADDTDDERTPWREILLGDTLRFIRMGVLAGALALVLWLVYRGVEGVASGILETPIPFAGATVGGGLAVTIAILTLAMALGVGVGILYLTIVISGAADVAERVYRSWRE